MFDHGITAVCADFHLHTRKDKEFIYKEEETAFIGKYVDALQEKQIRVGVITNHNKFDYGEFRALAKIAKKRGILLLPGVELSVMQGRNATHTLIVFEPTGWLEDKGRRIQQFLTSAFEFAENRENANAACSMNLVEVMRTLEKSGKDYFIVFAHVDDDSGFLKECTGGQIITLSKDTNFRKRVLAVQKMHSRDNKAHLKEWLGYELPNVEGSDPKTLKQIGKNPEKCYLRIGDLSYWAVKYALMDHKNRLCETPAAPSHGIVESAHFEGGKLKNTQLNFSDRLNTMIGIRGSGKSSMLEGIRYALELNPKEDPKYKERLVENLLESGGVIQLNVRDARGNLYHIRRGKDDKHSRITDENGNALDIRVDSIITNPLYYGQKDLSMVSNYEFGLLKSLVGTRVRNPDAQLQELNQQIADTARKLLEVASAPQQQLDAQQELNGLQHKMDIFTERGVEQKLSKQTCYNEDLQILTERKKTALDLHKKLKKELSKFDAAKLALSAGTSPYNQDIMDEAAAVLAQITGSVNAVSAAVQQINTQITALDTIIGKLNDRIESLKDEFAAIKREVQDKTIDPDVFFKLKNEIKAKEAEIQDLSEKSSSKATVEQTLRQLLLQRSALLQQTYQAYRDEADKINAAQQELKIDIHFQGYRDGFKEQMAAHLKGTNITETRYRILSEQFPDFAAIIGDWLLNDGAGLQAVLTPQNYAKLVDKLTQQYAVLLDVPTEDRVDIFYHDKLLRDHSLGQRASALILFILTLKGNDLLIIDQPEDDLDNKVIYEEVIRTIRARKPDIQLIFATHNANIPVLGDAEQVICAEYDDTRINATQGNIDMEQTQKKIIDIMEGGQKAFHRRQSIYSGWGSSEASKS